MDQALLFESPHQFCDFVRLHADKSKPKGVYQLLKISDKQGHPKLLLLNHSSSKKRLSPAKKSKIEQYNNQLIVDGEEHKVLQSVLWALR